MSAVFAAPPRVSRAPRRPPPAGACDAHAHIFGPAETFPLSGASAYAPPLAPFAAYAAMLQTAGMARGVLVQPSAYGNDHGAILDACARGRGQIRAVGLADPSASDEHLLALRQAGMVGLRFSETGYPGSIGLDALMRLAPRMKALGLQAHLWCPIATLLDHAASLLALDMVLVVDHLGGLRAPAPPSQMARFVHIVRDGAWWVKLSLCRASAQFPDYPDLRAFHDALIGANPRRLVWGSDWPHIRLGAEAPDVGHLLDLFDAWIGHDQTLRRMILADNPRSLFQFPEAA